MKQDSCLNTSRKSIMLLWIASATSIHLLKRSCVPISMMDSPGLKLFDRQEELGTVFNDGVENLNADTVQRFHFSSIRLSKRFNCILLLCVKASVGQRTVPTVLPM